LKDELRHLQSALEAERVKVVVAQAEVAAAKNETDVEVEARFKKFYEHLQGDLAADDKADSDMQNDDDQSHEADCQIIDEQPTENVSQI
jgi:hypothetical protein